MNYNLFYVFIFLAFSFCGNDSVEKKALEPIFKVKLKIAEPSGIAFYKDHLYIVSDRKQFIYKTNLEGKMVAKIPSTLSGLEGITFDANGNILVVDEDNRALIKIDTTGKILFKTKIKGKQKEENSGLEGICYNSKNDSYYLLNEKSPKEILNISADGTILNTLKISFAKDLSGICFDAETTNFWLLSDESEAIYLINEHGKLLNIYTIPVKKPEGIVVVNDKMYVVSDKLKSLFIFKKPD